MRAKTYIITAIIEIAIFTLIVLFYNYLYSNVNNELNTTNNLLLSTQKELADTQEELSSVVENLELEYEKSSKLAAELDSVTKSLDEANETILELKSTEYELVYMGEFKITYYCDGRYPHICGGNGVTASGKETEVGWTAAADWGVLPNGSIVYISGIGFREIQDVGSAVNDNHIDVLVQEHQEALDLGVGYEDVWILVRKTS